jgi:hypothetical protein
MKTTISTPVVVALIATIASAFLPTPARAVTVYSNDFESGSLGAEFSGAGSIQPSAGLSAFGFGSQHLRNDTQSATTLTLLGMAAHVTVTLGFDLAMWDSIDIGDHFVITAGDSALYDSTDFGNYYPIEMISHGPGTAISDPFIDHWYPNYGYGAQRDSARSVSYTFPHNSSSLVISWQYPDSQTGWDESFGIDNLTVSMDVVPEPAACLLACFGTLALLTRRSRS